MPVYQQKAEIVRTEKFSDDIYRFTVKASDIAAEAKPGQFVMIQVGEGLDPLLRRPFSVHQVIEGGLVQVLFKVIGRGTLTLSRQRRGEFLDILGPLGKGFRNNEAKKHYLVGGGIGIAPLLFLAEELLKKNEFSAIKVFLGARSGAEINMLVDDFAGLGLEVMFSTEDGSMGPKGLVTELIKPLAENDQVMVYGCGPHPMLRAVAGICRDKSWDCQVSLETIMACGLGACLGCTVLQADLKGYVHVCKDGPVFKAEEVAWL